jgi:hypothetical protein
VNGPTHRLSREEVQALKFAAHRQLARWAKNSQLRPRQREQRAALVRAVRTLVAEAARASGSSRRAVYRAAIDRGELAASVICPRLRINPEDVLAWMEGSCTAATAPPHSGDRIGVRKPQAADGLRSLLDKASWAA